jgi:FixJ family two-component response regulator
VSPAGDGSTVFVVDDDAAVRDALGMLFRAAGLHAVAFESAAAFLEGARPGARSCLVLDIRMPGQSGLALQQELAARGIRVPIVFITGHGDIAMAVEAVKCGAFDFIEKPFDDARLLGQVRSALEAEAPPQRDASGLEKIAARLSAREREVLERVLEGKPSRQIAAELFISAKTVEFHRARIMSKAGVRTVAQLFRVCLGRAD